MSTTTTTFAIPTPPPSRPRPSHHRRSKSSHTAHDFWKHFQERPLDAIFRPKSVALVGASEREGSVGRTLMWNLLSSPFGGTIYPVNARRRANIFGIRSYQRVYEIPERGIDLAIIAVPAGAVKEVMQDCVNVGVKGAVIISAGFKETGPEGAMLEDEIMGIAREGNMRVVGPNCLGVMNPISGLNATFATNIAKPGNVAFISQSGAMCTSILDWSLQANVGFSAFISIGSMSDVSWGDLIYYLGDDPNTKAIAIYMESIGDARSFMSAASEVAITKPIIVIKPGRTEQAAAAAASHTGSLAGSDDVLDAAFKRCGVLRVDKIREVFDIIELLGKQPRPKGKYLTIVTNAGGPGVISTDALIESGGQLAWLSEDTREKLNDLLPPHWSHANPIDLLGDTTPDTYAKAVTIAAQNKYSDGVLIILTPQAMTDPTETARRIAALSKTLPPTKPILASWMGGAGVIEGRSILDKAGIPTCDYPDHAATLFSYMFQYSVNVSQLYQCPRWCADMHPESSTVDAILARAQSSGRKILTEYESKQVLSTYGIPTVATKLASSSEEAIQAADELGYPVVVKINSETITHKTDVGGVKLNLHSPEQVRDAYESIRKSVEVYYEESDFQGVTVQPMVDTRGAYELIVGCSQDEQFGPVMLFGSGGTLVEVYNDRSLALPPLNTNLAHLMMKNTKIYKALKGVRGKSAVDIAAVEKLIVNFSHLVMERCNYIAEVEINPLLASSDTLLALDARIILHSPTDPDSMSDSSEIVQPAIRPYPSQYEQQFATKNGRAMLIRAIMPEDEPLIVDFHKRVSEESVYTRFLSDIPYEDRVAHDRLIRVCHVNYDRDIALVALDKSSNGGKIVAAGRLTKEHGRNTAEFSMLVADGYQGEGIGGKLLRELIEHGKSEGLDAIEAVVMTTNRAMIHVAEQCGFESILDKDEGVVRQYLDLRNPQAALPLADVAMRRVTAPICI
ncbi:hypothetical protein ACHAXT_011810 [Thalassiosira profunda]